MRAITTNHHRCRFNQSRPTPRAGRKAADASTETGRKTVCSTPSPVRSARPVRAYTSCDASVSPSQSPTPSDVTTSTKLEILASAARRLNVGILPARLATIKSLPATRPSASRPRNTARYRSSLRRSVAGERGSEAAPPAQWRALLPKRATREYRGPGPSRPWTPMASVVSSFAFS